MKRLFIASLLAIVFAGVAEAQMPKLSKKEISQGWKLLFDGKTSAGWTSFRDGRPFPETGWTIENGVLTIQPRSRAGDIITEEEFQDFELSLEFRISEGANSGIKYFILPGTTLGLEFQILDDKTHPDAKEGKDGNRWQGALYDILPPKGKKDKPIGKWNHARIISKGNHVEHWLNGKKIVEFERFTPQWDAMVAGSKYFGNPQWGTPKKSPILLQDHNDLVSFRNIKIREL